MEQGIVPQFHLVSSFLEITPASQPQVPFTPYNFNTVEKLQIQHWDTWVLIKILSLTPGAQASAPPHSEPHLKVGITVPHRTSVRAK